MGPEWREHYAQLIRSSVFVLFPGRGACRGTTLEILPGDYGAGEPPVPIPNTEVKPCRADGTAA